MLEKEFTTSMHNLQSKNYDGAYYYKISEIAIRFELL